MAYDALSRLVERVNAVANGRVESPALLAAIRAYMAKFGHEQHDIDYIGQRRYFTTTFDRTQVGHIVALNSGGRAFTFRGWSVDDCRELAEVAVRLGPDHVIVPYERNDGVILVGAGEIERLLSA